MLNLTKHWYQKRLTWLACLLLPLSGLFFAIIQIRRWCYQQGIKKITKFTCPVIVVGNLTVGGTGKTPVVIWLTECLKKTGMKPAIVCRGVGGKTSHAVRRVYANSDPFLIGDEAVLLAKRTACPVVTSISRIAAVAEVLAHTDCDIIISDDGLQHYQLGRDLELVVVDGQRRFGNGFLLPAGPLREPVKRLYDADFILTQGEKNPGEYAVSLIGDKLVAVTDLSLTRFLTDFSGSYVHAVAGVGNPNRFFTALRNADIKIIEHIFPDHYHYQKNDFCFEDNAPIIMTEKDAVKCHLFADERYWFLPVTANIDSRFERDFLTLLRRKYARV